VVKGLYLTIFISWVVISVVVTWVLEWLDII